MEKLAKACTKNIALDVNRSIHATNWMIIGNEDSLNYKVIGWRMQQAPDVNTK